MSQYKEAILIETILLRFLFCSFPQPDSPQRLLGPAQPGYPTARQSDNWLIKTAGWLKVLSSFLWVPTGLSFCFLCPGPSGTQMCPSVHRERCGRTCTTRLTVLNLECMWGRTTNRLLGYLTFFQQSTYIFCNESSGAVNHIPLLYCWISQPREGASCHPISTGLPHRTPSLDIPACTTNAEEQGSRAGNTVNFRPTWTLQVGLREGQSQLE